MDFVYRDCNSGTWYSRKCKGDGLGFEDHIHVAVALIEALDLSLMSTSRMS